MKSKVVLYEHEGLYKRRSDPGVAGFKPCASRRLPTRSRTGPPTLQRQFLGTQYVDRTTREVWPTRRTVTAYDRTTVTDSAGNDTFINSFISSTALRWS